MSEIFGPARAPVGTDLELPLLKDVIVQSAHWAVRQNGSDEHMTWLRRALMFVVYMSANIEMSYDSGITLCEAALGVSANDMLSKLKESPYA